ncbi:MAG: 5'-nucleotidase [Proteobacteria bacterium]|nr:5'-nucleotidase [Pseudomonadota bacterium]
MTPSRSTSASTSPNERQPSSAAKTLTVGISSTALFDLSVSNAIYQQEGLEAYRRYQISQEDTALEPGGGFYLAEKLLNINKIWNEPRVEILLLSRNSADTGLRVFNSIKAHELDITRAAFCGGDSPFRYIRAFNCDLFLSTNADDVRQALAQNIAAATLLGRTRPTKESAEGLLKIAFDGDSVLFSDEAERVFQQRGLEAFSESELDHANESLAGGPFKAFLAALHRLQQEFPEGQSPIRTALVTARGAPAHERVIRTLRDWDIRLDESLFLGGMDKTEFLRAFEADIFFDDQATHCDRAAAHIPTGHVPHGITNADQSAKKE